MKLSEMLKKRAKSLANDQEKGFLSNLFLAEKRKKEWGSASSNKFETIEPKIDFAARGDYMHKIDLKEKYFSIPLHKDQENNTLSMVRQLIRKTKMIKK